MENYSESDEAFARRLQAQEMGNFTQHAHADVQTPLMVRNSLFIYQRVHFEGLFSSFICATESS